MINILFGLGLCDLINNKACCGKYGTKVRYNAHLQRRKPIKFVLTNFILALYLKFKFLFVHWLDISFVQSKSTNSYFPCSSIFNQMMWKTPIIIIDL